MKRLLRLRTLLFAAAVVGVGLVFFFRFSEFHRILDTFRQAHPFWISLAVAAQGGTYFMDAESYLELLRMVRLKATHWEIVRASIVMEFLNDVTPSFGATDNLYLLSLVADKGLATGQGAVVLMVQAMTSFFSFAAVLLGVAIFLIVGGNLNVVASILSLLFVGIGILFWVVVMFALVNERLVELFSRVVHWVVGKIARRRFSEERIQLFIAEVQDGRRAIGEHKLSFLNLFLFKTGRFFFDTLTVYLLFYTFGLHLSFGAALASYSIATFLSTFMFTPGGIGSFEAVMVLTLKSYGASLEAAGVVTLAFRGLSYWLPIPVGLLLFQHKPSRASPIASQGRTVQ